MGFIPSASTKTLTAYLTQIGRQYILTGNKNDFNIKFFSLHDNDINYNISSDFVDGDYNILKSGFVPDITGDDDDCIKSIAQGIIVNPNTVITGGTNLNSVRPIFVGFVETTKTSPQSSTNTSFNDTFNVSLTAPIGDNTPITSSEFQNTSFVITVLENSQFVKNIAINGVIGNSDIIKFDNNPIKNITLSFEKNTAVQSQTDSTITTSITLGFTNLTYALEKRGAQTFTYTVTLTIEGTGGGPSENE
jgi:hypothetical protein